MKKPITNSNDFCCDKMHDAIRGGNNIVFYDAMIRTYAMYFKRQGEFIEILLFFCPWCGVHLPTDLRDTWAKLVAEACDLPYCTWGYVEFYTQAPKEFYTDKWWKKRGL